MIQHECVAQSLHPKVTRLLDPPQLINLVIFLGNAGKETSKSRISATNVNVTPFFLVRCWFHIV
jgi:hypothetical protein